MSIDFSSPSYRASGSDLTIAISPMGLVELADEEFEVHGPRINRYAHNWAFYLGHHWSYRSVPGAPQLTFNYSRAFADFINNFTFGRGFSFRSPKETSAIIPPLLQRVWEVDNNKERIAWDMGNQGGVSGDCFVKVAYEEPSIFPQPDPITGPIPGVKPRFIPGRVRILVLNSSYCFPEWHPHDRERLLRFKQKYRFWGTTPEGTRQVFTYTELITELAIEEYINDQLLDSRPNPLGIVPVVHIPNVPVSGSPWGLSDINDILVLNREYNEKATDISEIVNYHAAPITIMTGAKSSQLEKGANKVWAVPREAQVYNLELAGGGIEAGLSYLEMCKKAMHELTGVPEGALGDVQPISNTTGVALAIQYQPMMQRYNLKKITYGEGLRKINEIALRTLAQKEPQEFSVMAQEEELEEGQLAQCDFDDPITYQTVVHWPPPLPTDKVAKLNEIMLMMQAGLMSKKQALVELGEVFPEDKMRELFLELVQDAIDQGALDMLRAQINTVVEEETGMLAPPPYPQPGPEATAAAVAPYDQPAGEGGSAPAVPAAGPGSGPPGQVTSSGMAGAPGVMLSPDVRKLMAEVTTRAYGTRVASRRQPGIGDEDD